MSLEAQITAALQQSVRDAARAAQRSWGSDRSLHGAAMLTGSRQSDYFASSEAELTFETHADKIPAGTRDRYGVAGRTAAAHPRRMGPHASPGTLMQKTAEIMETTFERSIEERLRQI